MVMGGRGAGRKEMPGETAGMETGAWTSATEVVACLNHLVLRASCDLGEGILSGAEI